MELNQKDGPRSRSGVKPGFKHSKSLDREMSHYLKGKAKMSISPKTKGNKTSRRKSTISSLKHKLHRLKMGKQTKCNTTKTPRNKNRKKSSKEKDKNEKMRTRTPTKNKKKCLKETNTTNQTLKTPNTKIQKKRAFHSPIVDSIMRRKPNLSASGAWKDQYSDYQTVPKRTVL
eukprot:242907_1